MIRHTVGRMITPLKSAVAGTYASKLKGNKGREQTDDCMIVEEEVEQLSGETKKAWETWDKEYDVMEEKIWQEEKNRQTN